MGPTPMILVTILGVVALGAQGQRSTEELSIRDPRDRKSTE